MATRILLVDDHDIVRYGVRVLLSGDPRLEICGEAADGDEAIEQVKKLTPDIVILDLTMPVMNGFAAAEKIKRLAPTMKIIFFSIHEIPIIAGMAGADAFVHKGSAVRELPSTIERFLPKVIGLDGSACDGLA